MCSDHEKALLLYSDLLVEILSVLSVKSLLRFKWVCKSWRALIQETYFIHKHMVCAKHDWRYDSKEFQLLDSMDGLVMEVSNSPHRYCIRNPMTKQVLYLPNPPKEFYLMRMFYVPTLGNYKLLCVYPKKERCIGCKVLTVGTDHEWRPLDVPSFSILRNDIGEMSWLSTDEIFVVVRYGASEICCIEMGSECIFKVKIPETLTVSRWKDEVFPLSWEDTFSLAKLEEKNLLHEWVLEDYKKQKWVEKKIVLDFMNVYPDTRIKDPFLVVDNRLWVSVDENGEHILAYHLESKWICIYSLHRRTSSSYKINTSLVYIKGMQREESNVKGIGKLE